LKKAIPNPSIIKTNETIKKNGLIDQVNHFLDRVGKIGLIAIAVSGIFPPSIDFTNPTDLK